MVTLMVTDASGHGHVRLPPGEYDLSAAAAGRIPGASTHVSLAAGANLTAAVALTDARTLTVHLRDEAGAPIPGKVTVMCPGGCPFSADTWKQYVLLDAPSGGAAAIGYVGVTGELAFTLPPAEYERGRLARPRVQHLARHLARRPATRSTCAPRTRASTRCSAGWSTPPGGCRRTCTCTR